MVTVAALPPVDSCIDAWTLDQVRIRARILVEQSALPPHMHEDVQQDMLVELTKARARFDPNKAGWHTFVSRVLDCFCKNFVRHESVRNRRGHWETASSDMEDDFSLDARPIGNGVLADLTDQEDRRHIQQVIAELPKELRGLCEALMTGNGKRDIAAELGIGKSTLYRRLAMLREIFVAAGIAFFPNAAGHILESRRSNRVKG